MREQKTASYTIEDIARELGVSKTTVSRAISGKGRISEETRSRVQALMEKYNYRPSAVAKSLANNQTDNIALVLPEDCSMGEMSFFQFFLTGACETASLYDYDILVAMVSLERQHQLERILANRKVDGVILTRSVNGSRSIPLLREKKVPFVVVGATDDPEVISIDHDNASACRELTELLMGQGMGNLYLLLGDLSYNVNRVRAESFCLACQAGGIEGAQERILSGTDRLERLRSALELCLSRGADCILCGDDLICHRLMDELRERGVAVPGQVCVASFYDSSLLESGSPSVTSLRFAAKKLGQGACQTLLELMAGKRVESQVLPEYTVALRQSTDRR